MAKKAEAKKAEAKKAAARPASTIAVDLTFAVGLPPDGKGGLPRPDLDAAEGLGRALVERTRGEIEAKDPPFLGLPFREDLLAPVVAWADALRPTTTDVLLVGIGGSSRTASVLAATLPAAGAGRPGRPRLHVLDTVDPVRVEDLLRGLAPASTTLVAVSKSGSTLETAAGLLVAEGWLYRGLSVKPAVARTAYVCGEERNVLRERAEKRGVACFPVPAGVGGRFSGLSPVGLLPAALLGVDVAAVLRGARAQAARCTNGALADNPALALAVVHHVAVERGRGVTVCLPYADALLPFSAWWEQLVAESLGKRTRSGPAGVTPLPGVGPSDQHSLLQLLMEGPDDKLVVFVEALDRARHGLTAPKNVTHFTPASGRRVGEVLAAERLGTEFALAEAGRPSVTISLPDTSPASLGALLYAYEVAVMWWGRLQGVDPFDQPGVERGKVVALAGLTGSPAEAARALARHASTPRRVSR